MTAQSAEKLLLDEGFTFLFAPAFHPCMKYVMPARKALGIPTIFNLLGPLANPVAPDLQVLGVGRPEFLRPMAEAILSLGVSKALVVHSRDGMDEISPQSPTDGVLVEGGKLKDILISPRDMGFSSSAADLRGGDAVENLALLHGLLRGISGAIHDAVVLNAGATLWLAGKTPDLAQGAILAKETIISGHAKAYFDRWLVKAQTLSEVQN